MAEATKKPRRPRIGKEKESQTEQETEKESVLDWLFLVGESLKSDAKLGFFLLDYSVKMY